jgi:hypothetical protein
VENLAGRPLAGLPVAARRCGDEVAVLYASDADLLETVFVEPVQCLGNEGMPSVWPPVPIEWDLPRVPSCRSNSQSDFVAGSLHLEEIHQTTDPKSAGRLLRSCITW